MKIRQQRILKEVFVNMKLVGKTKRTLYQTLCQLRELFFKAKELKPTHKELSGTGLVYLVIKEYGLDLREDRLRVNRHLLHFSYEINVGELEYKISYQPEFFAIYVNGNPDIFPYPPFWGKVAENHDGI